MKSHGLSLAWLSFFFGCAYAYLLAESGPRAMHGNFWWSAQVSLFVLFFESVRFCLEQERAFVVREGGVRLRWPLCLSGTALGLHMVAGCAGYYMQVMLVYPW